LAADVSSLSRLRLRWDVAPQTMILRPAKQSPASQRRFPAIALSLMAAALPMLFGSSIEDAHEKSLAVLGQMPAEDADVALIRRVQAENQPHQRCLAGAVFPRRPKTWALGTSRENRCKAVVEPYLLDASRQLTTDSLDLSMDLPAVPATQAALWYGPTRRRVAAGAMHGGAQIVVLPGEVQRRQPLAALCFAGHG